jgi:hypothetical protein
MEGVLLFVRLALAATFATAALSKLVDLRGFRHTLREFGIPAQIAPLVPLAELGAAAALAVPGSVRAGALAVIALLAGFSSEIAAALARGRAPECRCFGQVHSTPVGPRTLARNAGLAAAASVVLVGGAGARLPAAAGLGVTVAVAAIALQVGRRKGRAREQVGDRAPVFTLTSAEGRAETLVGLLSRGRPVLLVFADPGCGPCLALAPDIARWQDDARLTVAVVSTLPFDGLRDVLLDVDRRVSGRFGISATPSAVMISQAGVIEAGPVAGAAAVESLVEPAPAGAVVRRRELIGRWALAGASLAVAPWPQHLAFARRRGCKKPRVRCGPKCCPPRFICRKQRRGHKITSRCGCPPGTRECAGACVSVALDPGNCGACGRRCPPGQVCVAGRCQGGADGTTGVGGGGGCTSSSGCAPGTACDEGTAVNRCPPGKTQCGCECVDTGSDPHNCGRCGRPCPSGQFCVRGTCQASCGSDLTPCEERCVDVKKDAQNCGRCGHTCEGINPACCGGVCVDLAVNPKHCGQCFHACSDFCECQAPGRCSPGRPGVTCA